MDTINLSEFDAITFHFDGNNNDKDDISALPIAAAIAKSAGLEDKISFFYGNNVSENNNSNQEAAMRESAAFAETLGIDTYSYQDGLQKTTNELVKILNSGKKVLAIEGGPMETIYRALEQTNPANRGNVVLLSHSTWNEDRAEGSRPGGGEPRTWADLRQDFPEVQQIDIKDQNNGSNNDRGFNSFKWDWLDTTNNPVLQEARDKMQNAQGKVNDPSDAGMLFYAITGNETANPDDAKAFFDANPPSFSSNPSPNPTPTPTPTPDPNPGNEGDVFMAQDGQLVLEAESATPVGSWKSVSVDGETGLLWDAANSSYGKVPTGQTLSYAFETDESGSYNIAMHSGRIKSTMNGSDRYENGKGGKERSDTGNDAYVAIVNAETGEVVQKPTKLFTGLGSADRDLKWGTTFDANHKKSQAKVDLDANTQYRLEISGRSDGYVLDRITLSNDGVLKDANAPESPLKGSNPSPTPDPAPEPTPDPDPIPTPDPSPTPTPNQPLLTFALVNSETDKIVDGYENLDVNGSIDLNGLDVDQYSVIAQVNPNHPDAKTVKSVKFESSLGDRTENVAPYALFGDSTGDFAGKMLDTGDYTIKATAYTGTNGSGAAIDTANVGYTVVDTTSGSTPDPMPTPAPEPTPNQPLMTFALVDAETDEIVDGYENLGMGGSLNLSGLDVEKYNVVAKINPDYPDADAIESVKFESNLGDRIENVKPYALFGDIKSDYKGRVLDDGNVTIKATAYSKDAGKGEVIGSTNADYTIINTTQLDPASDGPSMGSDNTATKGDQGLTPDSSSPGIPEGEQDQTAKGPCPVTGGSVCNCKKEKDDKQETDNDSKAQSADVNAPGGDYMSGSGSDSGSDSGLDTPNLGGMDGKTVVVERDNQTSKIMGTSKDDVISIRTSTGNSTTTQAGGGEDTVILYGSDEIPTGNYHKMLANLKQNPVKTATDYFKSTHTVNLGSGKTDGADTLSLISEIGAIPKFMLKHTGDNGRINGQGVAGENGKAYDHWAGVFGFVDINNFDPDNDTLNLAGHTTTLGESFTKNGDFFQTVYSEQNANNKTGPRAGAAHDDTFLGLLKFEGGAASADAIVDAINLEGMKNYVVNGLGKEVFEGDPTSNKSNDTLTDEPLMTFSLVNSETDKIVKEYENIGNGSEIDLSGLDLEKYNVVAQINPDHFYADLVESVKFESNLGNSVENIKPYALFGDIKEDYKGKTPETGKVMIKATAYSKDGGNGKAIGSTNIDYTVVNTPANPDPNPDPNPPNPGGMEGKTVVIEKGDMTQRILGTRKDDIISIRSSTGNSTMTGAGGGSDTIILYGSDEIPKGNYHDMLEKLEKSPFRTATQYFDARHIVNLGSGKNDGADRLSLVSELGATPDVIEKHTGAGGRVDGKGVAGENNQAYDHWAGVFGFVNIANFDPNNDTLELAGHTTTLGKSFTKNGHFFQTVYSEQNANNKTGPRAGAAHDDTFLGLLKFRNGASSADDISKAINVRGMENYVVNGTGKQVYEGDPTSNQSNEMMASDDAPKGNDPKAALDLSNLESYGGKNQDKALTQTISNNNTAVRMEGNGWKKMGVNYTITPETILTFEFRSDAEGEVHSIGFDDNNTIRKGDRQTSFQLFGVQDWGNSDFETYVSGDGWQSFKIPVGEYFTGEKNYLTFGNDHDIANPDAVSEFRNVMLYDAGAGMGDDYGNSDDMLTGKMANQIMSTDLTSSKTASPLMTYEAAGMS
ncbi:MAG: hypothetical protein AAF327_09490 [Cyanobacteria bacterium P01_A01_bin.37]